MLYKDEEVIYKGKRLKYTYFIGGLEQDVEITGLNGKEIIDELKNLESKGIALESIRCASKFRYGDEIAILSYMYSATKGEIQERRRTALERAKAIYDQRIEDAKKLLKEAEDNVS